MLTDEQDDDDVALDVDDARWAADNDAGPPEGPEELTEMRARMEKILVELQEEEDQQVVWSEVELERRSVKEAGERTVQHGSRSADSRGGMTGQPTHVSSGLTFLRAARSGDIQKVCGCLQQGVNVHHSNETGLNALHLAAKEGHMTVIRELLTRGIHVDAATGKGNSAIHIASLAGQTRAVEELIRWRANINVENKKGLTPLYMAAQEAHLGTVKLLLANKADPELGEYTPIVVARQQGNKDVDVNVKFLRAARGGDVKKMVGCLHQGVSVHHSNENGLNALHLAAKEGHMTVIRELLTRGIHVDAATGKGNSALHIASLAGNTEVVKELIRWRATVNVQNWTRQTPLYMAAQEAHLETVRLLLANNADPNLGEFTPIIVAKQQGHMDIVDCLERHNTYGSLGNEYTQKAYSEDERMVKMDYSTVPPQHGSKCRIL